MAGTHIEPPNEPFSTALIDERAQYVRMKLIPIGADAACQVARGSESDAFGQKCFSAFHGIAVRPASLLPLCRKGQDFF